MDRAASGRTTDVSNTQRRRLTRLAVGVLAGLAVAAVACGGPPPAAPPPAGPSPSPTPSRGPAPSSPPPSGAPGGVTSPSDLFGPACAQLPTGTDPGSPTRAATQPVGAAIATNPLLRSLTTALRKADLLDTLDQQHDVTVFAPDDQAFQAFAQNQGADRFYALLADQNVLGDLLEYHVVGHRYDRVGLVGQGTVSTLEGAGLRVRDAGDVVEVTDNAGTTARVVCGDIPTANATLFVVDQVLQPKRP
jgi:uncharacterized surface protein with fasciclin (FAS1) repeats